MSNPVEFRLALSNSFPSGTGSYSYNGSFQIVVQNLAYEKQVSIWAQVGSDWQEINAIFVESLPGNRELWRAPANNSEGQFVAKYTVNGATYWDNNDGANYNFPRAFDEFNALSGQHYPIVLGTARIAAGQLHIAAGVQNRSYFKVVGALFTTDNWTTIHTAFAGYSHTLSSGLEVWSLEAPVGSATDVKFALFYRVSGGEFWDNNFWRNYTVAPAAPLAVRDLTAPAERGLWQTPSERAEPSLGAPSRAVKPAQPEARPSRTAQAPSPRGI
jgi:hypothetical protein